MLSFATESNTVFPLIGTPRSLFGFEALRYGTYWKVALKKGRRAYFKVKEIIHMKFQNFVVFSFQERINNCHIVVLEYI